LPPDVAGGELPDAAAVRCHAGKDRGAAAADELGGCAFVFTNLDDMLKELGAWMEDPLPKMMIVGELQDGLVFEKAYKKVTGKPLSHWIIQSRSSCDEAARPENRYPALKRSTVTNRLPLREECT